MQVMVPVDMCAMNYPNRLSRFRLTFAELSGKSGARIPLGRVGWYPVLADSASHASHLIPRKLSANVPLPFQVWSRHSCRESGNEGLRVFSPNPRSAGLQRGAHLSTRKTTPLSGSCFERRLSVAGYPHSETPSFGERQPLLKKDERYGGGVT